MTNQKINPNFNHSKSIGHEVQNESILRRIFFRKPNINDIDEILRKYINIYGRNYQQYSVSCVLKLLTITNHVR